MSSCCVACRLHHHHFHHEVDHRMRASRVHTTCVYLLFLQLNYVKPFGCMVYGLSGLQHSLFCDSYSIAKPADDVMRNQEQKRGIIQRKGNKKMDTYIIKVKKIREGFPNFKSGPHKSEQGESSSAWDAELKVGSTWHVAILKTVSLSISKPFATHVHPCSFLS